MFGKVLVANRGEIAVRIFRTLRELGIGGVAVYSDADRAALHVAYADEAYALGGLTASESYLVVEKLLAAAERAGAEAVHPGYGFLAENAGFARAVESAGLVWIGPPPDAIELMGSKTRARQAMHAAGVPIIPGTTDPVGSADEVARLGDEIGYPLLIKAAAGGGGKGMKVVRSGDEAAHAFASAQREGQSYFADASVYVERYLEDPRHVEVQVLGDKHGNVVHVYERECSIQRRHQKVIEESPSPALDQKTREAMGKVAVQAAKAVDYVGAGTIEFLVDGKKNFYFLEMNTRIQVEHPITEMVTGSDLVRTQIEIAAGAPLPFKQEDIRQRGWAVECRVYAEDPENNFLPAPGRIHRLIEPGGLGIRNDSGVYEGFEVSIHYDPMISKLVAWGATREEAIARMQRALSEYVIHGPTTNIEFHRWILRHPRFLAGDFDTRFIGQEFHGMPAGPQGVERIALAAAAISAFENEGTRATANGARPSAAVSAWRTAARQEALRSG